MAVSKAIDRVVDQISTKLIEYIFRAGWLILAASASYIIAHFFGLIN